MTIPAIPPPEIPDEPVVKDWVGLVVGLVGDDDDVNEVEEVVLVAKSAAWYRIETP